MAEQLVPGFGELLRQLRVEAQLTQEELAEAAALSPRAVSDLERGIHRTARKDTAVLLAGVLNLAGPVRSLFVAAALGHVPAAQVLAARSRREIEPRVSRTSLPKPLTSFIGRERELAQAKRLLQGSYLVTLTGPGGSNKTRLCIAVAAEVAGDYPDGVYFVPLAPVRDPGLVPSTIAQSIGLQDARDRPLMEHLVSQLRERRLLIVLDASSTCWPARRS